MAPRQIPLLQTTPQFGPAKFPGGYIWAVRFQLPTRAVRSGHIIQEIRIVESGTNAAGQQASGTRHYWEAWPVSQGQTTVTVASGSQTVAAFIRSQGGVAPSAAALQVAYNDIFFQTYAAGNRGSREQRGVAAFYEQSLPADFVVGNRQTNAGALPSTTRRPRFWTGQGLFRLVRFRFDFRSSRTTADATLQTASLATGNISTNPNARQIRSH